MVKMCILFRTCHGQNHPHALDRARTDDLRLIRATRYQLRYESAVPLQALSCHILPSLRGRRPSQLTMETRRCAALQERHTRPLAAATAAGRCGPVAGLPAARALSGPSRRSSDQTRRC